MRFVIFFLILILRFVYCQSQENSPTSLVYHSVNVITGDYCEAQNDLSLNNPSPLQIRRTYSSEESSATWLFNHPNILHFNTADLPEIRSKDRRLTYSFDDKRRLILIQSLHTQSGKVLDWIRFSYPDVLTCRVETADGQEVSYRCQSCGLLEEVMKPNGASCLYRYRGHPTRPNKKIIAERQESDGRTVQIEYYDDPKDPYVGRVKTQKSPVGTDSTPVTTHRFVYHSDFTEVYDALDHKTIYRYDPKIQCLTGIEEYLDNHLYRAERFFWDLTARSPRLVSRAFFDGDNQPQLCHTFTYDERDNVIKETIYGELSGEGKAPLQLQNGLPVLNGVEHYSTHFVYSKEAPYKLTSQTEDNGTTTRYSYNPNNQKLSAKWIACDQAIKVRHFYFYSDEGSLIKTVVDDGAGQDAEDLSGVTERHITNYILQEEGLGKTETVEELCFNASSHQETLVKKTINRYSARGDLIQQEVFGSDGSLRSSIAQTYNANRQVLSKKDEHGLIEYSYDLHGNQLTCRKTTKDNKSYQTKSTYDCADRLLQQEETSEDGSEISTQVHRYDQKGNRLATLDIFGNATNYIYDDLGRLIQTTSPAVLDGNDHSFCPTEKRDYDIFHHLTSITDANGNCTQTRYNARGKPTEVNYPSGTSEKFVYNLDGSLREVKAKNGSRIIYHRDFLARVIQTDHYTPSGNLKGHTTATYTTFRLMSSTDEEGNATFYTYDKKGRQSEVVKQIGAVTKRIEFFYNDQDELVEKREWYGEGKSDYISYLTERDEEGNITAHCIADASGQTLKKEIKSEAGPESVHVEYSFTCNQLGQQVRQVHSTDAKGCTTTSTMDALGRIDTIVTTDTLNQIIRKQEMRYDAVGNKVREIHYPCSKEGQAYAIVWQYDVEKRLESVTEAAGSTKQAKSQYHYDANGQLIQFTKPDGVSLVYTYDDRGRVISFYGSDNSFFYRYSYGEGEQAIEIEDCLNGTTTYREYVNKDQLIKETLGNGLAISYAYDEQGRRTQVGLPDASSIEYTYNALHLTTINRYSSDCQLQYSHHYSDYDPSGRLLAAELIGGLGKIAFAYDSKNRLNHIQTPYWTQAIEETTGTGVNIHWKDPVGSVTSQYTYDTAGQLVQESGPFTYSCTYDSLSNRSSKDHLPYLLNEQNQLIEQNGIRYCYDKNGCLTEKSSDGNRTQYKYDALNRLTQVIDGESLVEYTYDAFNRRLTKIVKEEDSTPRKIHYLYEGHNEIGTINEDGEIIELRVLGLGKGAEIGAAIAVELKHVPYAPIHNHRGDLCCLIDLVKKEAVEIYRYSAFGEREIFNGQGEQISKSEIGNPWQFASKRYEEETGLINFGKRLYDPATGRWTTPDPLGFIDGPNLYSYVHNDPLNTQDLYGLFSWSDLWNDFISPFTTVINAISTAIDYLKKHLSFENHIQAAVDEVAEGVFGTRYLALTGYYVDKPDSGTYGNGEFSDKVRVTCINGILNTRSDCMNAVAALSETHGGVNIHYVIYPTEGWTHDLVMGGLAKLGYVSSHATLLAETWKKMIQEMGGTEGGGVIVHYAHSIGGTNTMIARDLLSPEEQRMIRVITLGSATIVPNTGFQSVINYLSCRDGISITDPIGFLQGLYSPESNVVFLGSHFGIPFIDHMITMETYRRAIEMLGREFVEAYGPPPPN